MKLQLEDVFDVLVEVFPEFDFLFLFDQSSGHTKMRVDGLNTKNARIIRPQVVEQMTLLMKLFFGATILRITSTVAT